MQNNIRFDLSNYLIHFFRDIDLDSNSSINFPEHMGWQNLYEDTSFPAFFMLRSALRNGRLWATWSIRNNVRTIYGRNPAICFTEMPIAAYLEAGAARAANGEAMSEFAFVFSKKHLFLLGARPVISGLSAGVVANATTDSLGNRIYPEHILPYPEQYRFVSYSIGGQKNIDWTHEREWRLPQDINNYNEEEVTSWDEIPGLDIFKIGLKDFGVIVKTKKQADLIISDMLTLVDNHTATLDNFGFVLVKDLLLTPEKLRDPSDIILAISNATVTLDTYFNSSDVECNRITANFNKLVEQISNTYQKSNVAFHNCRCWLWLHDNMSPLTRALLRTNRISVTPEGRYLASLPEFGYSRSIEDLEDMTTQLSALVQSEFNTPSCYFSVHGSNNPSDVPFYTGDHENDISFYNCSWSQ